MTTESDSMDALAARLTGTIGKIEDQERFMTSAHDRLSIAARDYQEAQKAYNAQLEAVARLKLKAEELRRKIRMSVIEEK